MDLERYMIAQEDLGEVLVPLGLAGITLGALYLHAFIKDKQKEKQFNQKLKARLPNDLDTITDRQIAENYVRNLRAVGYKVLGKDDDRCSKQVGAYHTMFSGKMTEYKIENSIVVCIEDPNDNPTFCVWVDLPSEKLRCRLVSDHKNTIIADWKKRITNVR